MIRGLGDSGNTFANIWNTPGCTALDAIWVSQDCQDAMDASFYGTANIPTPVVPPMGAPALTQTGVGVSVPGNDYSAVPQSLSNTQITSLQQQASTLITNNMDVSGWPWYVWVMVGLVGLIVFEKL